MQKIHMRETVAKEKVHGRFPTKSITYTPNISRFARQTFAFSEQSHYAGVAG